MNLYSPARPFHGFSRVLSSALMLLVATGCATPQEPPPDYVPVEPSTKDRRIASSGAIYQASNNRFFFEDIRARRAGDVINVILDERTDATKTASTKSNKGTSIGLPSPTLFGGEVTGKGRRLLSMDVSSNTDFAGSADSSQSNRLNGSVAVTVDRVLSNGNLWIRGQKTLTLNQGSEVVRVAGLIRAEDITPDNTIMSTQIASAKITYGGRGLLADSNRAGWFTRLLNGPLWPF